MTSTPQRSRTGRIFLLALLAGCSACDQRFVSPVQRLAVDSNQVLAVALPSSDRDSEAPPIATHVPAANRWAIESARCGDALANALQLPAAPGTPQLDRARVGLLANVKAEPSLFLQPPTATTSTDPRVAEYQLRLQKSADPATVVREALRVFRSDRGAARAVLLRDGYLYADRTRLAAALVDHVRADLVFDEPEIWVQRGALVRRARRGPKDARYRYSEGPEAGRAVRIVLFDRVGTGAVPPAVHRDIRHLRYQRGFRQMRVEHATETDIVARLRYGQHWIPTLLRAKGALLEAVCEMLPVGRESHVVAWRRHEQKRNHAVHALQNSIAAQADDELPFDEPRHEIGQQDGKLRPQWHRAYSTGGRVYEYNADIYPVFGQRGQPLVPQVCVDFLLDTLERAAGTWWLPKGQPRQRRIGRLDLSLHAQARPRRILDLIDWVVAKPDWFSLVAFPKREQIPMGQSHQFLDYLVEHADDFIPGDMVVVGGYVPWDPRQYVHYHSFFVFESDPLTAMPLLIAGNPVTPGVRTWKFEMTRTPKRAFRYRIRAHTDWLARVTGADSTQPLTPPLLSYRR